jgi:hypothetical protein
MRQAVSERLTYGTLSTEQAGEGLPDVVRFYP